MKNFYANTMDCMYKYNRIQEKMNDGTEETTEQEDEFITNFCIYLAHALIQDHGMGKQSREELVKTADIIKDVIGY